MQLYPGLWHLTTVPSLARIPPPQLFHINGQLALLTPMTIVYHNGTKQSKLTVSTPHISALCRSLVGGMQRSNRASRTHPTIPNVPVSSAIPNVWVIANVWTIANVWASAAPPREPGASRGMIGCASPAPTAAMTPACGCQGSAAWLEHGGVVSQRVKIGEGYYWNGERGRDGERLFGGWNPREGVQGRHPRDSRWPLRRCADLDVHKPQSTERVVSSRRG